MSHLLIQADARRIPLEDGSVHCVVTSPPYWGLRDYGVEGQLGLERHPDEYVAKLIGVFREVRRVLRNDGTLWVNLGDTFATGAGSGRSMGGKKYGKHQTIIEGGAFPACQANRMSIENLAAGNLVGIPWRVALAMQADGWMLRSEIIWHKRSPMPGSQKTRPTVAHEQVFLFAKRAGYFYDWFSVLEKAKGKASGNKSGKSGKDVGSPISGGKNFHAIPLEGSEQRNLRTVWTLSSESYKGAHFATFPSKLVTPCIKAGSSERGCCAACGTPWRRLTAKERVATRPGTNTKVPSGWNTGAGSHATLEGRYASPPVHPESPLRSHAGDICGNRDPRRHTTRYVHLGWEPGCKCGTETVPCTVFDPFGGAGTTVMVAEGLGRIGIATELKYDYCRMALERIRRPHKPRRTKPEEAFALKGLS